MKKRLTAWGAVVALLLVMPGFSGSAEQTAAPTDAYTALADDRQSEDSAPEDPPAYFTYKNAVNAYRGAVFSFDRTFHASEGSTDGECLEEYAGRRDVVSLAEAGKHIQFQVQLPRSGLFAVELTYLPGSDTGNTLSVGLLLDGKKPFAEADQFRLETVWHNADFTIKKDSRGNDIRPAQVQVQDWHSMTLRDIYAETCLLYAKAGEHTLALTCQDGGFYLSGVRVYQPETLKTYAEYAAENAGKSGTDGTWLKIYEGETAEYKSDSTLYPIYDRSGPVTQPYAVREILLNTIGGENWKSAGQWIEWTVEVPKDGYYTIGMRARQNLSRGLYSYRNVYVDGQIPFAELKNVSIPYDRSWRVRELGGEEPYRFYLTKGQHTVRLEASLGEFEYTYGVLYEQLTRLNTLYRRIVMITGTSPDTLRNYSLQTQIPGLTTEFTNIAKALRDEVTRIETLTGSRGSEMNSMLQFARLLERMAASPDTVPGNLSVMKSNISTLAELMRTVTEKPLEIDYIYLACGSYTKPQENATFWQQLVHETRLFVASFAVDYSLTDKNDAVGRQIDVWVMMGRDQAQIIKNMLQDEFFPQENIGVNLSVVNGSLTQAIMAGRGPDVVIGLGHDQPVELGVRGALLPLEDMAQFDEVTGRFMEGSLTGYRYNGHTYALPETQEFMVMLARTDILEEFGLKAPSTWDDMRAVIPKIVQEKLEVGIPSGMSNGTILPALLMQNGMTYFNRDASAVVFDSAEAIRVYESFISFFREYAAEAYYSAVNRFRTGEMPLMIGTFSLANQIAVQAPEIQNLWTMLPLPGTVREDGTVDRSVDASGTANVITANAKDTDAAWRFLSWWSQADSQSRFARELEMQMGEAARYSTANTEAFQTLGWSKNNRSVIEAQRKWAKVMPQPPGNYIVARNLANMFVAVTENGENIRKTLIEYTADINTELGRKRAEFAGR